METKQGDLALLNDPVALIIRGTAKVDIVDGVAAEYAAAAEHFFGEGHGRAWFTQVVTMFSKMARIAIKPEWLGILDFEIRFPSAFSTPG